MPPLRPDSGPSSLPSFSSSARNLFMTIAWYGHLKFKLVPLVTVVLVSWGIAFVENCFAVPANRIGTPSIRPRSSRRSRK